MKKFVFLLTFSVLILALTVSKAQILEKEIITVAENFISSDKLFNKFSLQKVKGELKTVDYKGKKLAYIVELKPLGFVVVSVSKNLSPIPGYSTEGNFDFNESEYNSYLAIVKSDMTCKLTTLSKKLSSKNVKLAEENQAKWADLLNSKKSTKADGFDYQYGPNLPVLWGGVNSVDENGDRADVGNYFTPNNYSPGCVATSMSQIMRIFNWPPVGYGDRTDYDNSGDSQGEYYAGFGRMWYDWDNMKDIYNGYASTDIERRAMGRLAKHCGVALDMEYESSGSTALVSNTVERMNWYFRYSGHYEQKADYANFWPRMRENIADGYAVQLAIRASSNWHGHANICDGYRYNSGDFFSDFYYHLDNGWWGTCNGWYQLLGTFNDCGYDIVEAGAFDIRPDPMFNDEVTFSETDSKTFTMSWKVSKALKWTAFELQESKDNGAWVTISNEIAEAFYTRTVATEGNYSYRVRAKSSGYFYGDDSYSEILRVPVEKITYLSFDGDDSYFVADNDYIYDNPGNDLDISDNWTIETWLEVDTRSNFSVILDRKTAFSLYLIDDTEGSGDYAIRFVARDASNNIIASIRSEALSDIYFNDWVHVAVTRDGTTTKMFINGTKVDEDTDVDFNLAATSNSLNIGARYWTIYENYIDGRIDEVRISDIARYDADFCPDRFQRFASDGNTNLLLHMDAFIGTTIKDYTYNFINPSLRAATNDPNWASSTCPRIMTEPENLSICEGSVSFSITAVQTGSYQWQLDDGSGFTNMIDGGVYSGATTNTLIVSDVAGLDGMKYRCFVTGNALYTITDCSETAVLTVYPSCTVWDGSAWTPSEPDITKTALIEGDYTLPYDISCKELTVLDGFNVTVPANLTLRVQNAFENHGTILLESEENNTPTGAFINSGSITNYGTMTAQRFISEPIQQADYWGNWHLSCSPLVEDFEYFDHFDKYDFVYRNNESTYDWTKYYGNDNLDTDYGFLLQTRHHVVRMLNFTGTFRSGDVNLTLPMTTGTNLGWSLISNPYPSPIDWNAASGWTKTDINTSIYTFDTENNGDANQYSVWDGTVGTYSGSRYIQAMQGFFVQATANNAILSMNDNIRVSNSTASGSYLKTSLSNILKLQVFDGNNRNDEIIAYFGNTESRSLKNMGLGEDGLHLYFIENEEKYVISRFVENEKVVNLGFYSESVGDYTFKVSDFNFENRIVYLEDKQTNKFIELAENETYKFSYLSNEKEEDRFSLHFYENTTAISENELNCKIYSHNKTVYIVKEDNTLVSIEIVNLSGQIVKNLKITSNLTKIEDLEEGIYLIRLKGNQNSINKKLFVK